MNKDAVINPICGKKSPEAGSVALMAATLPDVISIAGRLGFDRNAYRDFFSSRIYEGNIGNASYSLIGPFIGAPHAVILLENLVALGVETVVFSGWCGSLSADVKIGDIILATGAYSDEGTSRHYGCCDADQRIMTHPDINRLIENVLNDKNIPYKTGTIWTTDAIYRETPEKIAHYKKMDAIGVEMELSALLTVAVFRDIRLSSLLVVSDEVGTLNWKPGFGDPRFKTGRKRIPDIMASFVERILHG